LLVFIAVVAARLKAERETVITGHLVSAANAVSAANTNKATRAAFNKKALERTFRFTFSQTVLTVWEREKAFTAE
jgi:hypothetical protein